jgi:hypothetical protein
MRCGQHENRDLIFAAAFSASACKLRGAVNSGSLPLIFHLRRQFAYDRI